MIAPAAGRSAAAPGRCVQRVRAAYDRIAQVDRPEIWIHLFDAPELLAQAHEMDLRVAAGEELPLAGRLAAVKGNIDVAGLATTAGCPSFGYFPARSSPVVQRLVEAGALVIGTTNLDQFATGLVGTRSPYGAVRDATRPDRVSGGSSSGSAVAVALGIVDLALGTDTAGSGRVPAAFGGIVGLKPTRGLLSTVGVVPACRELDCVSVLARTVGEAQLAAAVLAGPVALLADEPVPAVDPLGRSWPPDAPLAAPPAPRIAVPDADQLPELSAQGRAAFAAVTARLADAGARLVPVDPEPFIAAGRLLYGGAFVAQRYAAVGEFLAEHHGDPGVDPTVASIVLAARDVPAHRLVTDTQTLDGLRLAVAGIFAGADAVLLPTVPFQPTRAQVDADPIGVNARLGIWTTGTNLLDLAAIAVPAGGADGGHFGVTLFAPAFADRVVADLGRLITGEAGPPGGSGAEAAAPQWGPAGLEVVVFGAHLSGMALNWMLTGSGGRYVAEVATSDSYRLYALDLEPPGPGLIRIGAGELGGGVAGELWRLPEVALARLLAGLPDPMALGPVELADGSIRTGFLAQPQAVRGATDITASGGWRAHLAGGLRR